MLNKLFISFFIFFSAASAVYAAPEYQFSRTIIPATSTDDIGTTSPQAGTPGYWRGLFVQNASTTELSAIDQILIGGTATTTLKGDDTGTSTINSSLLVTGDLEVEGGLIATLYLVSSGDTTIGGNFTVTGTSDLQDLTTLAGFISSASSTVSAPFHVQDIIAGSSTLAIDQSAYFALTGGSVGIASSTPWGLLSVEQQSSAPVFAVSDYGTSTPHLLIDGMGRVGMGSSSPWGTLSVHSFLGAGEAYNDDNKDAAFVVGSTTAGGVNDTQFIVNRNGNVGIGTASPATKLDIHSADVSSEISGGAALPATQLGVFTTDSQAAGVGGVIGLGGLIGATTVRTFAIIEGVKSNSTDSNQDGTFQIKTYKSGVGWKTGYVQNEDGDASIGTVTALTQRKLTVAETGESPIGSRRSDDSNSRTFDYFEAFNGVSPTTGLLRAVDGVFQLVDTSDKRLKENIISSEMDALNIITNVPVNNFNFIGSRATNTGFIAQDVQAYFPQAVSLQEPENPDSYLMLSRSSLIPVLWKAIQEQQGEIEGLRKRILELEKKL